jgi:TonB family protein
MSEHKSCVRCERAIDRWSKICPYCNWDQSAQPPAQPAAVPVAVAEYRPPSEFNLKKKALYAGGGVLALILAFLVGMIINKDDAPETAPETIEQQIAEDRAKAGLPMRADTPLVPTNEPGGVEQPITSAPAAAQPDGGTNDYQRTDATAVSADEYAEMARRASAEKERMAALVDPRTLTGPAYAQSARTPQTASTTGAVPGSPAAPRTPPVQRRISVRTRPVPEYQPLPQIRSGAGKARLSLLIGADGRVRQVDVQKALDRDTSDLIAAVQSWRFKPATENGEPVAAPYSVEISFQ